MALLFGLSFVVTKYALRSIPPFTLIFLRFCIASLFLGILFMRKRPKKVERGDRWRIILTSLIVPGLYFLAETYGLKLSSATSVSLLVATIPIFAAIFAFLLLKERIGIWRGMGIALSVIGVGAILISVPGGTAGWKMVGAGNLLGICDEFCVGI
jgi:drug/metabolite transporter (DMT)-like permease